MPIQPVVVTAACCFRFVTSLSQLSSIHFKLLFKSVTATLDFTVNNLSIND